MTGNKPSAARRIVDRAMRYLKDNRGVSTVEYALIVVAVVAIVGGVAAALNTDFQTLVNELGSEISSTTTDNKGLTIT